jgi:hypothetical protein
MASLFVNNKARSPADINKRRLSSTASHSSLGLAFADRQDLEILSGRFQNKCFVDCAG